MESTALEPALGQPVELARLPMDAGAAETAARRALRNPSPLDTTTGVFSRVREIAAGNPDTVAVVAGERTLTYRRLCERVRQVRLRLLTEDCRPGHRVGVIGPRGADTVAAFLAIESLGAIYLPVDPGWPASRVADMLRRAAPRCVLAHSGYQSDDRGLAEGLRAVVDAGVPLVGMPDEDAPLAQVQPARSAGDDEPRYIIHTSGSTGRPKGVVVGQSGLFNHLLSMVAVLRLRPCDTVAFTASPSYVISIWQMLAALLVGGRVAVVAEGDVLFGRRLVTAIVRARVTVLELVPAAIGWLVGESRRRPETARLPHLRCLLSTGENLPPGLAADVLRAFPQVEFRNAYGATECADDVALHRITAADLDAPRVPAGTPLPNVALYLLVRENGVWRAAEPGKPGELWVGGAGVALGYLNEPDLTRAAFFADGFDPGSPTGRIYSTGDLAVFLHGRVHCLGRADRQVKVAGVRIELDEVEAAIAGVPGVSGCAVVVGGDGGEVHLVAHFTAEAHVTTAHVHAAAQERLPKAMVPHRWVRLDQLPRNHSGKVDYRALGSVPPASGSARADARPRGFEESVMRRR